MGDHGDSSVNVYGMVPDHDSNLAALICFAILWAWNFAIGLWTKQWWFSTAFFIACGLETAGYIGRFLSSSDPYKLDYFLVQIVCLTIAPAFYMGGVYYLLAKFSMIFGGGVSRLKPMAYSYIFISCDLASIVLQAIGGGMAAMALNDDKDTDPGTHIMVAGLAVQVAAMCLFFFFCFDFMYRVYKKIKDTKAANPSMSDEDVDAMLFDPKYASIRNKPIFRIFVYAITLCSVLIFVRCIYRLIELAEGWTGYLILREAYFLVLEALIVFIGTLVLSVIHPGFVFGRNANIPVKGLGRKKKAIDIEEGQKDYQDSDERYELSAYTKEPETP